MYKRKQEVIGGGSREIPPLQVDSSPLPQPLAYLLYLVYLVYMVYLVYLVYYIYTLGKVTYNSKDKCPNGK